MNASSRGYGVFLCAAAAALAAAAPAPGGQPQYIAEDAVISGKTIQAFADGSGSVTVVRGDFSLRVGKRTVSGQDAVLWIRTTTVGEAQRHDITVYVEGAAKVVEPDGATTTDRKMLVTLRSQGRLSTSTEVTRQALANLPLYRRAKAARAREMVLTADAPDRPKKPTSRPPPPIVVAKADAGAAGGRAGAPAAKAAAKSRPAAGRAKSAKAAKTGAQQAPQPVHFEAGAFSSQRKGTRRYTVARGGVYLCQGNADSDLFLELRSQRAVVISIPSDSPEQVPPKDTTSPLSPRIGGGTSPLGGREKIVGVYLEGDVIISRGERSLSGSVAYYDFTTDRAIVLDPVFRSVQEARNIPIYVRAKEARLLSAREVWFRDAKVSTSDFATPTYHIGAKRAYLMDKTPYDEDGMRLGEYRWLTKLKHTTFNVRGVPLWYWPYAKSDLEDTTSPISRFQVTRDTDYGFGINTEWHLFRLLGLVKPKGFRGRFSFDLYEEEVAAGIDLKYVRERFSGYSKLEGILDANNSDDFGDKVRNVNAPPSRGRILIRHKHFLPQDWQLQFELSYLCDRNYLRQFHPAELYAGKEQETLLYAKKQRDNWAVDALLKARINRFLDQDESAPDLGVYLVGEPLLDDRLTFFHESHVGAKRYRPANFRDADDSDFFARLDTRDEINFPIHLGPINIVPYAVGRLTYWGETVDESDACRAYGQIGLKMATHIWRVFNNVESRLWDLHRLKHVLTPFATMFLASDLRDRVLPPALYPLDPEVEGLDGKSGIAFGLHQVLQTKRGPADDRQTVDWMRLSLSAGWLPNSENTLPADGRLFWYRPENSLGRNFINADYEWRISDSTLLQAYANFDVDRHRFGRWGTSLAVARSPRLRYLAAFRVIPDLDSAIGSFGFSYKINPKYTLNVFEQYDFDYRGGSNMVTTVTITRKFPRWYAAFTVQYNQRDNELALILTLWPEGIPEFRIGQARLNVLGKSSEN